VVLQDKAVSARKEAIMKIQVVVPWLLIFTIVISSCTIDINQPSAPSPTALSEGNTTPQTTNGTLSPFTTILPVTWGSLNLSGKLLYTSAVFQNQSVTTGIRLLDLTTGNVNTIFQAPRGGWVDAVAVSPDHQQMILSYAPPTNTPSGAPRALYRLPVDGSGSPQLLFTPASEYDQYYQPEWSPDGHFLYFTHLNINMSQGAVTYEIWRMPFPNGKPEKLADKASWPRVSDDGTRLVYVWINPGTGVNRLVLANADGTEASKIPIRGTSTSIIDAPMFSADNQSIFFSAPNLGQSSTPGVIPVRLNVSRPLANGSIPSDWWSVPVTGGKIKQLTNIRSLALFGNYSPDKKHIALYSADGIFVMYPDGSGLTELVDEVGQVGGTVSWIP
jgi:Tol biopolymer transport system component